MLRSRATAIAAATVCAPTAFMAALGAGFCAATLHVPRRVTPAPPNAQTVEISAPNKTTLSAWWMPAPQPTGRCVIVLHGIADSRRSGAGFAPMFLSRGYSVLAPDSRAHGASGGGLVTYGLLEKHDVIAWTQWLRGAGCHRIYGLGESLGASILIQAAAVEPAFAAIAAEAPYADLKEIAEYRMQRLMRLPAALGAPVSKLVVASGMLYARLAYGLDFSQVSPERSIAQASTPILLIHGQADRLTPPSHSERLAAANSRNCLWLVPNALHTGASAAAPEEFRRRVLGWFEEH